MSNVGFKFREEIFQKFRYKMTLS